LGVTALHNGTRRAATLAGFRRERSSADERGGSLQTSPDDSVKIGGKSDANHSMSPAARDFARITAIGFHSCCSLPLATTRVKARSRWNATTVVHLAHRKDLSFPFCFFPFPFIKLWRKWINR
jgi:hypothetical protein